MTNVGEDCSEGARDTLGLSARSDIAIVGIGASSGGLEACRALLSGLPEQPGFGIVLVVHLDPEHESVMAKLLDRSCRLSVVQASEGCQVQENHVYVVPPRMRLSLQGGVIRLGPLNSLDRSKPIDLFFSSLAIDQGRRAIGVILSGNGSDGTLGLRAIKDRGGLTLVQDPESAAFDSMPRSALAHAPVDRCLSLVEMAVFLVRYVTGLGQLDSRHPEAELESFRLQVCQLLKRELQHDFSKYKKSTMLRRIHRRMLVVGADTSEAYASILDQDGAEARSLLRELLISVTQFFRDPSAFEALAPVIGRLIERKNDSDEKLRIWVPACATGEEVYSLAMLVVEQFERVGKPVSAQIFATEIDLEALGKARAGRYPESIAGEVSESRLRRFFTLRSGGYQVSKALRAMCLFSQHNVTSDPPFGHIDLVSCRNLLIYLDTALQNRVLSIFHYALNPQGVLFLGASETLGESRKLFAMVDKSQRIFEAQECSKRPPSPSFSLSPLPSLAPASTRSWSDPGLEPLFTLSRFLLPRLGITVLVLDDQDRVKDSYGHPDRYLTIRPGPMDDFLFALVRKTWSSPLRLALLQSRREQSEVMVVDEIHAIDGAAKRLEVKVFPARLLGDVQSDDWLVCFQETELRVAADMVLACPVQGTDSSHIHRLEDELESTRHRLRDTTDKLEAYNEELRSTIEELVSMNEELQASNDELESAREETQSVNQELRAVNSELHASVGERDVAHLDLLHLFSCNPNPAIFLDTDQRIRQFTPSAKEVFHLLPGDKGRPLVDIRSRLSDWDLSQRCQEVCLTLEPYETLLSRCEPDSPARSYQTRILPYLNLDNRLDGVVLSFVDVSELQAAKSQTERRERQLSAVTRLGSLISGDKSLDWLYDQALRKVSQVLSVEVACLLRRSAQSQSVEVVCARGLDPGEHIRISELPALAETLRTGRTVTASKPSTGGMWSAISTRIPEDQETPWALGAFSRQAREFTFDEVDFLESVAFLLGTAQARSQEHLLNVLDRLVATAMTSNGDFLGVAPAMLAGLGSALAASQCEFWLCQPGSLSLSRAATFEGESGVASSGQQDHHGPTCAEELVATVWKARTPICLDGHSANGRGPDASPLSSAFAFPLLSGEERLGVLYCCLPRRIFCSQRLLAGLTVTGFSLGELIRRTRAESALREAARHKDGFLAMLGHELRNPLAAIRNGVQLTELAENQADRNEAMGIIDRQSSQMALLIDSLLDMNRIALGKVSLDAKAMDLTGLAQSVLDDKRPIFEARGLALTFKPAAEPAWILGDKVRMVQVLDNLLGNSLKFTEGPGFVSLSLVVAAGSVLIQIKDSGQGLTPELAAQVFEPFRQGDQSLARPHGGLGLGLALVKQIVELHGGRVSVSSQGPNLGCEFSIVLAGIAAQAASEIQTAQADSPLAPQSILLIEDDLDLALSLGRLLEQSGHEVRHALDGRVALDLVQAKVPGVVLCDLGLPGDLDGLALLRQLRATKGMVDVPVIAMTGYGLASDKARSMKAGFWTHLTKPFEMGELQAILCGLSRYPGALRLPRPDFCRILVVDDNTMIAQATSRLLEKAGFEARHAFSAAQALQVVDEWAPHLAILDLGLPDQSGFELKAALSALATCRDCVFLAMTGSDESEDLEKTHRAGFVAHLTKPVSLERLLQELDRLCPLLGSSASQHL